MFRTQLRRGNWTISSGIAAGRLPLRCGSAARGRVVKMQPRDLAWLGTNATAQCKKCRKLIEKSTQMVLLEYLYFLGTWPAFI